MGVGFRSKVEEIVRKSFLRYGVTRRRSDLRCLVLGYYRRSPWSCQGFRCLEFSCDHLTKRDGSRVVTKGAHIVLRKIVLILLYNLYNDYPNDPVTEESFRREINDVSTFTQSTLRYRIDFRTEVSGNRSFKRQYLFNHSVH